MATQFSTPKCYPLSIVTVNIANKSFPISAHCRTLISFLSSFALVILNFDVSLVECVCLFSGWTGVVMESY